MANARDAAVDAGTRANVIRVRGVAHARRDAGTTAREDGFDDAFASAAHVVRVFCQVEGAEKQAIASTTHGDAEGDARTTRAEACERACAIGCERAAAGADANADAGEVCAMACAEACERRADANGKFEVCLTRGSEEMRFWGEELRARETRERELAARLAEHERDATRRGDGGDRGRGGE
jgi:hypothetical protein